MAAPETASTSSPSTLAVDGDTVTRGAWFARTVTLAVADAEAFAESVTVSVRTRRSLAAVALGANQGVTRASSSSKAPPPSLLHR